MHLDPTGVLHVKSVPYWFELERDGRKPNTIRVVTDDEFAMCLHAHTIRVTETGDVPDGAQRRAFTRAIAYVCDVTDVVAFAFTDDPYPHKHVVLICWEATR